MRASGKRGKGGEKRRFRRRLAVIFALLLLLPLPLLLSMREAAPAPRMEAIIAEVDGEIITRAEFEARMPDYRGDVLNAVAGTPGCDAGAAGFWITPCGGTLPLDTLKAITLEALIRTKVQQAAAREAGLVQDTGYDSFLAALDKENRQRQARAERGEVIYGARQYSEKTYYAYMLAHQALKLREHLAAAEDRGEAIDAASYDKWLGERTAGARVTIHFEEYGRLELLP